MKVLVTGATGFVGRWLVRELEAAGHEAIGTPASSVLEITDRTALADFVSSVRPDAVAHLAGVAFAPDATRDPDRAFAVNEGGTRALLTAIAATRPGTPVLVTGSSDVYGRPDPIRLPIDESHPTRPDRPYGRSKLAQEVAARTLAAEHGIPLVVTRAFNHTGPGQRGDFVVPALASRILAAALTSRPTITAGNVDVRRDIGDVRDVVRAYRLLLEGLSAGSLPVDAFAYNVATGSSVAIREIIEHLARLAGIQVRIEIDPDLVRPDDPPDIRGDATRLTDTIQWRPEIPLATTLADVMTDLAATAARS